MAFHTVDCRTVSLSLRTDRLRTDCPVVDSLAKLRRCALSRSAQVSRRTIHSVRITVQQLDCFRVQRSAVHGVRWRSYGRKCSTSRGLRENASIFSFVSCEGSGNAAESQSSAAP